MTDSQLIDPFDDPATLGNMGAAPVSPQAVQNGGLIDPFDDPGFLDRMTAEQVQGRVQPVLQREFGGQEQRPRAKTLQEFADETYAFEDLESRGNILPLGRRTKDGPIVPAVPGFLKDIAEKALLPGHAAKGGAYTADDAAGFTLDFAIPGSQGRAPAKRSDFVRDAPSTEALRAEGVRFKDAASKSGVQVNPDSFTDLVAGMETTVRMNELDPKLHPGSSAAFARLEKAVGQEPDLDRLQTFRRLIGQAQRTTAEELSDDRRIAGMMQRALDDYVEKLQPKDLKSGDASKAGANLKKFRSLYARSKKSEIIEDIIEKAGRQASGFENGVRIGFRQLINRKGGTRGFTKDEVKLIEEIAQGGSSDQKLMRLLGKLSFDKQGGSNLLGGSIGVAGGSAAGSAVGGPVGAAAGAVLAPAIGAMAQKGAEKAALDNVMLLRAMAATGRSAPKSGLSLNTMRGLMERGAGPLVNSMNAPIDPYDPDIL
ncbi:hypothetical protein [Denitrobaculum tricleocarpae]|uniref:Uncharacterized protein n=1 Tax=Denitrobaculum tricleocarpae TaxID=2591009 RepID=A0A545TSW7_9PROT|nr:hypothetical protein [Denitrobaculum tricleocarpae]TQV80314.1 hypothetical protein FKG95_08960 [Denitrobaculum tricleocarpae]